jgi:serine/threonine-protein kinase
LLSPRVRNSPTLRARAITVADSVSMVTTGVAWLDDGTIVYRDTENRLRRVPDVGGDAEIVWSPPPESDIRPRLPTPLPGARGVLFSQCVGAGCPLSTSWVVDLETGGARELVPDVIQAWYAATGHVVYVRPDGGVFAAPFDLGSLALTGPAVPVLEGVMGALRGLFPDFALSPSGSLLMMVGQGGGSATASEAVWVSRNGAATPVDPTWQFGVSAVPGWGLSPDGSRLAIAILDDAGNEDIWIKELDRGPASRLTVNVEADLRPRWTPDGGSVSFLSTRSGNQDLYARVADATLPTELAVAVDEAIWEAVWSLDGNWLVLRTGGSLERDIWGLRLGVDSVPTRLLASDFDENAVALSPDGEWLAYQSNETGQTEIYVRPFSDVTAGKWAVSVGGGSTPLWAHSGRELFYVDGEGQMVAAQVNTSTAFAVSGRQRLFSVEPFAMDSVYASFDISPDDQRFFMIRGAGSGGGAATALILVENWFEELREKVGN